VRLRAAGADKLSIGLEAGNLSAAGGYVEGGAGEARAGIELHAVKAALWAVLSRPRGESWVVG